MEYSHEPLRAKQPMALSNQKQVEELNKIKNTSTEGEILNGLQTKDHFLQPSTSDVNYKRNTQKKRVSSERPKNTPCKCIKMSDEMEKKSICTMSKKEESLLGKVRLMIGEQMNILNDSFNQKVRSLNRRVEQIQCKRNHEETAKTFLKKISKLEGHINAVIAFQKEMDSKKAVPQIMVPCTNYQNGVLNQFRPSAFYPGIINVPSPSNTVLLPSYIGFTSQHIPQYVRVSNEFLLVSTQNQHSTTAINSEDAVKMLQKHIRDGPFGINIKPQSLSEIFIEQTDFKPSVPPRRLPKAERRNIK